MNTKKVFLSLLSAISLCLNCQTSFSTKGKKASKCEDSLVGIGVRFWNDQFKEIFGSNMSSFKTGEMRTMDQATADEIQLFDVSHKNAFNEGRGCIPAGEILQNWISSGERGKQIYAWYVVSKDPRKKPGEKNPEKERPVAFAIVEELGTSYPNQKFKDCLINWFWTDPDFQKKGYGYKLLDSIIKEKYSTLGSVRLASTLEGTHLYRKLMIRKPEYNKKTRKFEITPFKEKPNFYSLPEPCYKNWKMNRKGNRSASCSAWTRMDKEKWHILKWVYDEDKKEYIIR